MSIGKAETTASADNDKEAWNQDLRKSAENENGNRLRRFLSTRRRGVVRGMGKCLCDTFNNSGLLRVNKNHVRPSNRLKDEKMSASNGKHRAKQQRKSKRT